MVLELKHISFGFTHGKPILQNLSLSLEKNKVYALMGSNGAGKTTLFNLLTGFLRPQSGGIYFSSRKLTGQPPFRINRLGIARTFQDLRLITKLSVKENVVLAMRDNPSDQWLNAMLPGYFHRKSNATLEVKADDIIHQFFLDEVAQSNAGEISYGQQKLLSLACCVANGATLLLLDEPVAGIQPEYRNKIATLIKLIKGQGKTILLIEHNTDFINEVADRIFFLHDGIISTFETIEALREDKQVMEAYM